jgi:hypothetical protein
MRHRSHMKNLVICKRLILLVESRGSSVSIVMDSVWTAGFQFPAKARFSFPHSVQTGSGGHPASYSMGTGAISQGLKRQRLEIVHSPPSSAKVKNSGAIPSLPIRLHDVMLHYLSIGIILPFYLLLIKVVRCKACCIYSSVKTGSLVIESHSLSCRG